ncbi:copper amine oxidase N-terminal domain-containing protein [Paenibacillus mesophilus]|uniref:copper amine oxidase N-terminal domain-containing protein n=1 Tax=Paenibacillus mesophilus TaxID=2582849 RepID=UPI0013051773|nr:copper amine oxidase N-terminal domain-containing protein [Paenibacillus mesophilus]
MLEVRNYKIVTWAVSVVMLAAVLLLVAPSVGGAESKRIEVYTDKQPVEFSIDPLLEDGTTLVQLRPLFESLGIEVSWNGETQTVSGKKEGRSFSLTINSKTAQVNGQTVTLTNPATIVDGHTLVPLRFVGEATGAVVGWNSEQQTIGIYSEEFIKIFGLSITAAQEEVNKGVPAVAQGTLHGFYAKWKMDLTGITYCSTLCWDYYYFINDKQVATVLPDGGLDALDCGKDQCLTYEIKGDRLVLSNGKTYSLKIKSDTELEIDGDTYTKYMPAGRMKLEGKYVSSSYSSSSLGSGLASSYTYIFNKDGTFFDNRFVGHTTDGSAGGDNSGVSTTVLSDSEKSGTYTIVHYTLLLNYKDGTTKQHMFFLPEQPNVNMLRIGGRDFLIEEADGTNGSTGSQDKDKEQQPYPDLLTTEKIAQKQLLFTWQPKRSKELKHIKITLEGYQWAKLTIDPAYIDSFKGYGDNGIIALTAKYRIENESDQTVHVNSLKVTIELPDTGIQAVSGLAPKVKDELKPGESVEKMSVILLPTDRFQSSKDFELAFGPLNNLEGKDVFQDEWLGFNVWKDSK